MGHRTDMMYRAMTYFVVATLHIYRADIPEDAPTDPEQFMRAYPELIDRIFDEASNLFGYELSHLQMCKGIIAYFLPEQSVSNSDAAAFPVDEAVAKIGEAYQRINQTLSTQDFKGASEARFDFNKLAFQNWPLIVHSLKDRT